METETQPADTTTKKESSKKEKKEKNKGEDGTEEKKKHKSKSSKSSSSSKHKEKGESPLEKLEEEIVKAVEEIDKEVKEKKKKEKSDKSSKDKSSKDHKSKSTTEGDTSENKENKEHKEKKHKSKKTEGEGIGSTSAVDDTTAEPSEGATEDKTTEKKEKKEKSKEGDKKSHKSSSDGKSHKSKSSKSHSDALGEEENANPDEVPKVKKSKSGTGEKSHKSKDGKEKKHKSKNQSSEATDELTTNLEATGSLAENKTDSGTTMDPDDSQPVDSTADDLTEDKARVLESSAQKQSSGEVTANSEENIVIEKEEGGNAEIAIPIPQETIIEMYDEYEEEPPAMIKRRQLHEYPEYDVLMIKGKDGNVTKSKLALARLARTNRLNRRMMYDTDFGNIKEPKASLACTPIAGARVSSSTNVNDLARPAAVSWTYRVICTCTNCQTNAENEAEADRAFLNRGEVESPILRQCDKTLPDQACSVLKRKPRKIKPKGVDYVSPLKKVMKGTTFGDIFAGGASATDTERSIVINPPHGSGAGQTLGVDSEAVPPSGGGGMADEEIQKFEAMAVEMQMKIANMLGSSDWVAEVVVITTSFQPFRKCFLDAVRIERFLELKGVEFFAVDVNVDIGRDSPDFALVRRWNEQGLMLKDPKKLVSENPIIVPQVYIDGVPIGEFRDLTELNDSNDLDYILGRQACPNCLCDRHADAQVCTRCGARYSELISSKFVSQKLLEELYKKNQRNNVRVIAPTPEVFERRRRRLGLRRLDEDMSTWFSAEKLQKLGCPSLGFTIEVE